MPKTPAELAAQTRYREKNGDKIKSDQKDVRDRKREADPDYRKKELALLRYKLTAQMIERMYEKQKGTCPSCMRFFGFNWGDMDIDHDHETDQVRCLLCRGCNIAEGRTLTLWPFLKDELWEHINRNLKILEGRGI